MLRPKLKATLIQEFGSHSLNASVSCFGTLPPVEDRDTSPHAGPDRVSETGDGLPLEGDIVGGHYRLVSRLGEGMFGRVYVAQRTDVPEHRVALKVMTRAVYAGRNVERELVMLAAATHPHIVQLKDHGMTADYVWLTMPLYDGETLAERLDRGPLSLREAYELFLPIARGVEALHDNGLRHQDIKPENIFLAAFGDRRHPVLLDLGVAVECNATFVAGTALYGAPEQIVALGGLAGHAALSEKMDTYCLAATLLRSLVGSEFFPGENAATPYDIASALEERERTPLRPGALPELTGEPRQRLGQAFCRWLTRDPAERPSAKQMAGELDVLLEQEREAARAIADTLQRDKTAYRRARIAFAAVALVGCAGALYGYSKRETWRLASELERAKAEGAASFDKLDTCVAAHQLARTEAEQCVSERAADEERFMQSVTSLVDAQQAAQLEADRQIEDGAARLRSCNESAREAAEAWEAQRSALEETLADNEAKWAAERADLSAARAAAEEASRKCDASLAKAAQAQSVCQSALLSCDAERDMCMTAMDGVFSAPAAPPAPGTADPPKPPDGKADTSSAPKPEPPAL